MVDKLLFLIRSVSLNGRPIVLIVTIVFPDDKGSGIEDSIIPAANTSQCNGKDEGW